jgi:hypothetical protein
MGVLSARLGPQWDRHSCLSSLHLEQWLQEKLARTCRVTANLSVSLLNASSVYFPDFSNQELSMDSRYPIGKFTPPQNVTPALRQQAIGIIAELPAKFRDAVKGLTNGQLDTPYREGGWTVRQVAHHVPESHMNAYVRLKLALTEKEPTVKPYDEALWAKLPDAKSPIEVSLDLLDALHERWVRVWRGLQPAEFARTLRHPDHPNLLTVDWLLFQYAWHGRHHTAHITELRKQKSW